MNASIFSLVSSFRELLQHFICLQFYWKCDVLFTNTINSIVLNWYMCSQNQHFQKQSRLASHPKLHNSLNFSWPWKNSFSRHFPNCGHPEQWKHQLTCLMANQRSSQRDLKGYDFRVIFFFFSSFVFQLKHTLWFLIRTALVRKF